MTQVTFGGAYGTCRVVDTQDGEPLVYAARDASVAGIIVECRRSALCGACHSYIVSAPEGGPVSV